MAPRKKSAKKSNQNSNQSHQSSQPSKFGIQHFFERHSQNPKPIIPNSDPNPSTSGNPTIPCNLLKSHRNEGLDLGSESRNESNSGNVDSKDVASGAVIRSGDEVHLRGKDEEAPSQDTPEENLIPVMGNAMENQLEESPEISKSVSVKRFKFSPGMLIKQSQDDGGEAVTWKISPVNERLHKVSKHLPDAIKVLADSSRVNMMSFQHCSQLKSSSGSVFKVDKWLSSPPMKTAVKSLTLSNGTHPEKVNSNQDMGNENAIDMNNHGMANSQSPFTTPPSLPYCHDKPTVGVDPNVVSDQLGSRQHKKALLDLLDQVEDVISVEELTCKEKKVLLPRSHNRNGNDKHVKSDPYVKGPGMPPAKVSKESPNIFFLVLEVSEKQPVDSSGPRSPFKVLRLLNEQSGEERVVQLFDEWYESVIAPGDTVHVVGDFDGLGMCDVNHDSNFIIVHPDILVSGTRVASSFTCPRRTVLDERLKSSEQSAAALIGTLLHQIFQAGLIRELPTKEFLEEYARVLLQKNIEGLYACGVNEGETHKTLMEAIPRLLSWILLFRDSQGLRTPSVDFGDHGVKMMEVSEVVDIEEMAWAPRYGLKGMIDASIRFKAVSNGSEVNDLIMPLEFKSGKATSGQTAIEHRAQVMLYTLLMSERYKKNIDSGLLYYLHTDQTQGVVVRRSDLVGLIMRRNELAKDILKASTTQRLPPMLRTPNMCRSCRHLNVCTIYHKAQGGSTETSGLGDTYDSLVNHLTDEHGVFLEKWDRLIDLEAKDLEVVRKEIWSRSETRTNSTSCISSIVLDTSDKVSQRSLEQGNRFVYRFVRQDMPPPNEKTHDGVSLDFASSSIHELDSSVKTGDYVILSTESDHLAVASGVIMDISRFHVDVSFSKRLRLPRGNPSSGTQDLHQEVWRIDKDEFMASFAIMRFNLIQLFLQNEGSSHLRRMIVELEAPRYDNGCIFSQDPAVSYIWSQKNLNDDQRRAILKILTAKDYTLVLGMPGTGKTSTMVHAVKALLMRGASILLTSYTNSAVDNLLIKLKSQGVDFIRIGRHEAVHEEIRGHCISAMDMQSTEDIKLRLDQVKVVAVTCLGVMSPLLANKRFDVCIMDEAGQTTLPVSLGPLMFASMFVLVGDHYQLPPLVKSAEARENGMGVSLFCRLSEAHPQAISALQSQYRMCASIMELSNGLIYGNRLRCGSPEIENAKLMYTSSTSLTSWLKEVLDPDKPVIFINTDFLPAFEVKDGKSVSNPTEASIVSQVTDKLVQKGIRTEDIGIITPYNSQTNLIGQALSRSVEINTIDKYQGRDKDCILVSFVRSSKNPKSCAASLLGDWHRINVALTRAKKKLVMVGSCKTLSKVPLLKLLIEKVEEQSGILSVSNNDINPKGELKRCSQLIR